MSPILKKKRKEKKLLEAMTFCPPGLLFGIPVCFISCCRNSVLPFSQNKPELSRHAEEQSQNGFLYLSLFLCVWSKNFSASFSFLFFFHPKRPNVVLKCGLISISPAFTLIMMLENVGSKTQLDIKADFTSFKSMCSVL